MSTMEAVTHRFTITGGGPDQTDGTCWSWSCTCGAHREDIRDPWPDYTSEDPLGDILPGHP